MSTSSPAVLKWFVALELRRLRIAKNMEVAPAAKALGIGGSTLRHAENGRNFPHPRTLTAMLELYGVPERKAEFEELVRSAKAGREWFHAFSTAAPKWFELYLGLEAQAGTIDSYDALLVPGLLQTAAYAAAVIETGDREAGKDEVARRVDLRMARQDILTQSENRPTVWCVVDEAVLQRRIVGAKVMRAQLDHLLALGELPNVTVQIMPMELGSEVSDDGSFTLMSLPGLTGNPFVVYADAMIRGSYYTEPDELRRYRTALTHLQVAAAKPEQSASIITRHKENL